MRSQRAILILASLSVLMPAAFANHPVVHEPPGPFEPVAALLEMGTDGYVVSATRVSERVFEVRVLHQQVLTRVADEDVALQYAFDPVDVEGRDRVCLTNAACSNQGVWFHSLRIDPTTAQVQLPGDGFYPDQVHALRADPSGATYLEVTVTEPFNPTYQGLANFVVAIDNGESNGWVRGLYNVAKVSAPLDALDAVGQVIRIA